MKKVRYDILLVAACFFTLSLYPMISTSQWVSNSDVHALLEFFSSMVAVTAGVMVLLHFFTTGRWFFLFISIGFIQISAEEFVHAIFSFDRLWDHPSIAVKLAISTTWLTGRASLLSAFFIAYIFGKATVTENERVKNAIIFNLIGFAFSVVIVMTIFNSPNLSSIVKIGSESKQLLELAIAVAFFVIFCLYFGLYWRQVPKSPLLLSIICCVIFQFVLHVFVFDCHAFYDAHWDSAHVFKLVSYFFPIFGVWGETVRIHRLASAQYIDLQTEMRAHKAAEESLNLYRIHLEDLVKERTNDLEVSLENLKATQEQLVQSEKLSALGAMVAGVSHELNTPLGNAKMAITTLIERIMVVQENFSNSRLKKQDMMIFLSESGEISTLAEHSIERAVNLVQSFKQVAVDQTSEQRRNFDLQTAMNATISSLRPSLKNQPWEIVVDIPEGITMDSYPGPLEQVVLNLVNNSIQHGFSNRTEGHVIINAKVKEDKEKKSVLLTVSDDGNGIAPDNLSRIFDPFYTTRLGWGGSGIGLNIVHRIINTILGGQISVESCLNSGAVFTLTLPIAAPNLI